MKIVFVLDDLGLGGVQRHTLDLAQALKSRFDLHLCSIGPIAREHGDRLAGLSISSLGLRGLRPRAWAALARELDRHQPDVIVSLNQVATLAATATRILHGIRAPLAVAFHSTIVANLAGWMRTLPFIPAVRSAEALIYISANQRAYWLARGLAARRTVLIRNGIRVERFPPPDPQLRAEQRARLGYQDQDYVIGLNAMFRWEKNHGQLLDALAALRGAGLPAKVLLVGDGPKRAEIEARIAALGLGEHVRLAGLQHDVRPFLAAMDVGVLCSTAIETLSLAALEAMASGVPMVMSELGGASEVVVDGESGHLFPVGDTAALVDRLTRLADPDQRAAFAMAARARVQSQFSYAVMVEAYAALFRDLGDAQGTTSWRTGAARRA